MLKCWCSARLSGEKLDLNEEDQRAQEEGHLVPLWRRAAEGIPVVWSAAAAAATVSLEAPAAVFTTTAIAVATTSTVIAHSRTFAATIATAVSWRCVAWRRQVDWAWATTKSARRTTADRKLVRLRERHAHVRVWVREIVEAQQRHDGLVERAHLDQRHLGILLDVVEVFHKTVLREEVHKRILVALQFLRDTRDVQQRHGRDGILQAAAPIAMQWRAREVARVVELEGVHIAVRHRHGNVLGVVHAQLLAKDHDAVEVVERGRRLVWWSEPKR